MPRDSFGAYSLPNGTLVNAGDVIQPSQHNPAMSDLGSNITSSLSRDGLGGMRADLAMGGFSITNADSIAAASLTLSGALNVNSLVTTGNVTVGNDLAVNGDIITLNASKAIFQHDGADAYLRAETGRLILGAGATNYVTLTTGGLLGVGTATPGQLLETRRDQNAQTGAIIRNATVGVSASATLQWISGTANSNMTLGIADNNGAPSRFFSAGSAITTAIDDCNTHTFRTTAGVNKVQFESSGNLRVFGDIFYLRNGDLLVQHDGSDAYLRSTIGSMFLGANGTNFYQITAAGALVQVATGYEMGFRDVPKRSVTGNTALLASDRGKYLYLIGSGGYGVTIPPGVMPVDSVVEFVNDSPAPVTLSRGGGVAMWIAGVYVDADATIASGGYARILCVTSNRFILSGQGIS